MISNDIVFGAGPVGIFAAKSAWLGADVRIDCVGCEAAGSFAQSLTGVKLKRQAGAATVLHWCINSVRKGRTVFIVGVYGPTFNAVPIAT